MDDIKENLIVGIGNPLLDISAKVDKGLLEKYKLKEDDAIMAQEMHLPLYKELQDKYSAEFLAGGSVLNSLCVAQWILEKPRVCTYFGCVGSDQYGTILKERANAAGVNVQFQYTNEHPTGTCAVLITGMHRSLCANLAAATNFTVDHLSIFENKRTIEGAKYFYVSGFFLAVSLPSIMVLANRAVSSGRSFLMNLSAPFVSEFFYKELMTVMPYVDVLFGNNTEYAAFAKASGIDDTDDMAIAQKICNWPKQNGQKPRVVVMTRGCNPVLLVTEGRSSEIPVVPLPKEAIVDTNGAGDAFTGGFLAQYILKQSHEVSIECGMYAAREIIQRSGCTFEGKCQFSPSV